MLIGYDKRNNVYANAMYKVHDTVSDVIPTPGAIIDIYCIWDNAPTIVSPEEINFDYSIANSFGINISNGTVSASDLEAWLLAKVTASDYEWSKRHTGSIPVGNTEGYSLRIVSLTPNYISDSAGSKVPISYTVTFAITDDVGNSATAVTKLFLGDMIDILIEVH